MSLPDGRGRVLQLVQPDDGGVAEHVLHLSLGLRRCGFDVEVAASPAFLTGPALAQAGIRVHTLDLRRRPGAYDVSAAVALRRLDAQGRYGLVHAHSSKAGALGRVALPSPRRLVYTPHCAAFYSGVGGPAGRLMYRGVEQALVPRTAAFVAVSQWEAARLARGLVGIGRRIHVIPNGVPPCDSRDADPGLLAFKAHAPLIGLVTVLRPGKDVFTLLRAMEEIAAEGGSPARLAIVGNGPLEAELRREIERLGLADRVRHFAFRRPVERWLRALDLFVLPTDWESLPLSVLESMRCGLPVVATDVGGVGEAVQDGRTGRLVPPRDAGALAEAILDVLRDPARREAMGQAARNAVERRFSVERMVDDVAALYRALLSGGSHRLGSSRPSSDPWRRHL
jgi:glycosyltransferase involved in cell wall biosynthesis